MKKVRVGYARETNVYRHWRWPLCGIAFWHNHSHKLVHFSLQTSTHIFQAYYNLRHTHTHPYTLTHSISQHSTSRSGVCVWAWSSLSFKRSFIFTVDLPYMCSPPPSVHNACRKAFNHLKKKSRRGEKMLRFRRLCRDGGSDGDEWKSNFQHVWTRHGHLWYL